MTHPNQQFLAALDAQIEHLSGEQEKLKPIVEKYQLFIGQLELLKRTRNAFTQNGLPKNEPMELPLEQSNERERIGDLSRVLLSSLREAHRAVKLEELTAKVIEHGITVNKNAVSGALGRAIQQKKIARRSDDSYQWIGE